MSTINAPAHFPGTPAEVAANYDTHWFDSMSMRCIHCDLRGDAVSGRWVRWGAARGDR